MAQNRRGTGITRFDRPNQFQPQNTYVPLPFRELFALGKEKQQQEDLLDKSKAAFLEKLNVDARDVDVARRNELIGAYEQQFKDIVDQHEQDPRQAMRKIRDLSGSIHKGLTRGELGAIGRSREAESAWQSQQQKLYEEGKIDLDTLRYNQQLAGQQGAVARNEAGAFDIFQGRRGVNVKDLTKFADDFIKGYKSDKHLGGIRVQMNAETGLPEYFDRESNERVDMREVGRDLQNAILSDPEAVNYIRERSLTTGQPVNQILNTLISPYAQKAGFDKRTSQWKLGSHWDQQAKAYATLPPSLTAGVINLGGTAVNHFDQPLKDMDLQFDAKGNISSPDPRVSEYYGSFQEDPEAAKRKRNQLYAHGAKTIMGFDPKDYAGDGGDKRLADLIRRAEKDRSDQIFKGKTVSNDASTALGKAYSRALPARTIKVLKNGVVQNADDSTLKGAGDWLDSQSWFGGDIGTKNIQEELQKKLNSGAEAMGYSIPGVDPASVLVSFKDDAGQDVMVAVGPDETAASMFDGSSQALAIANSQQGSGAYVDPGTGQYVTIQSMINPQTGKYEQKVNFALPKKELVGDPSKYNPAQIQEFFQLGTEGKLEEIIEVDEERYLGSNLLNTQTTISQPKRYKSF
jgi:hypothetical protein